MLQPITAVKLAVQCEMREQWSRLQQEVNLQFGSFCA